MVLFESTHVRNKSFFKEIYFDLYYKRGLHLVLIIVMGILLVTNLILVVLGDEKIFSNILFSTVFLLFHYLMYRRAVKTSMAREHEVSGNGTIFYTISIFEDKISHKSSLGSEYFVEFSKIKKTYETANYILLQSEARQLYVMDKNNFTIGECDECIKFLREKGYHL